MTWAWLVSAALEFWPIIAGAIGVVLAFIAGSSRQKTKQIKREAKADEKAHDRINKVPGVDASDRGDIIERLRKHGQ